MMLMLASFLSLALWALTATAMQIYPLIDATSQGDTTAKWTYETQDASRFGVFNLYLRHPSFRNDFALRNNVRGSDGEVNMTLPVVPAQDGYTLLGTSISNINEHYAESAPFAIGEAVSSTMTSTTSMSTPSMGAGAGTTMSVRPNPTTTPSFGTTVVNTNGGTASSVVSSSASSGPSSGSLVGFNGANRLSLSGTLWSFVGAALGMMVGGGLFIVV
ncbi:hypothetical protein ONZ45_g8129 [Pleurotus djamor]|nr:hypothetical protein ONZ45_g8129 [Pleurotus djamor]